MVNNVYQTIMSFYSRISCDSNHRYRSWEHCYTYFQSLNDKTRPLTEPDYDMAALHLAFFLASWGMYRPSNPLLWKDYRIHIPAVKQLFDPVCSPLWNISSKDMLAVDCNQEEQNITLITQIITLSDALIDIYKNQLKCKNCEPINHEPTETLITKILLGTTACTPAFDRFFISGLRNVGLSYSEYNNKILCKVFQFYKNNQQDFDNAQRDILKLSGINYPVMKLIDMYFWVRGNTKFISNAEIHKNCIDSNLAQM